VNGQNPHRWVIPFSMATPIRVLIADDSDSVRSVICNLLTLDDSIAVTGQARNYQELLAMLKESAHDVVLMDIHMPGEGQVDPSLVRGHFHGSCLLAMSIWNDEETSRLAESFGAVRLLDKGDLAHKLIPTIHECVQENGKAPHV
jgi:DNA-binding NarL/FixJ family response regulator